jgi:hypothetical protein
MVSRELEGLSVKLKGANAWLSGPKAANQTP